GFAGFGDAHDKIDAGSSMGRENDRAPQGANRIQDRAGGIGQGGNDIQGGRFGERAPAPNEIRASGFTGDLTLFAALADHEIQQPRGLFSFRPGASSAENGRARTGEFGLDEKVAKGGMGKVGAGQSEDHFGITGQFDDAAGMRMVGQRNTAQ